MSAMWRFGGTNGIVALAALILPGVAEAAAAEVRDIQEEYVHRSWSREDGLPDNQVEAILQTRDGYIWVTTPLRLARFDGVRFVVFDLAKQAGIDGAHLSELTEDNSGTLWITTDQGILSYGRQGLHLVRSRRDEPVFQPVAAGQRAGVWTFLNVPSPEIHHLTEHGEPVAYGLPFTNGAGTRVSSLMEMTDGRFWLGKQQGGFWLNPHFKLLAEIIGFPESAKPFAHAVVLNPDGTGFDLLSASTHFTAQLYRIDQDRATLCLTNTIVNGGRSLFLTRDRLGNLWMPAGKRSLYRYGQEEWMEFRVPGGLDEDYALCLKEDRDGNLWFGSSHSGLHCLQRRRARALTMQEGLAGMTAECLLQTKDGSMWIGTENGLTRVTGNRCTNFDERHGLARRIIRSLAEDQDGVLWIGTLRGLHRFEHERCILVPLPGGETESKIRAILPARSGGLWVATVRGLLRVCADGQAKLTVAHGLSTNEVLSLLEDGAGGLWAGTPGGGLNHLTWAEGSGNRDAADPLTVASNLTVTVLSTTNGLSSNVIRALSQDAEGVLWIGTDHGLNRYAKGVITVFTKNQGLAENQVNALLEDDLGRIWLGGDRTVCHVSRRELNQIAQGQACSVTPVYYDQADGFPSLEVSGKFSQPAMCQARDGRLWIGTAGGVAILDPRDLPGRTNAPLAVIEQIRANGEIIYDNGPLPETTRARLTPPSIRPGTHSEFRPARADLDSAIVLPAGSARILELEYTASTFTLPETTRFKYRLAGWDKDWIDGGTARKAYYANVHPDDYRFEVVAAGKSGRWSQAQATVTFRLAPFFYETWWFYGLSTGALCLGTWMGIASRVRKTRRIAELERQIALDEQRKRIARDIHDELGASLTQIAQLSGEANALVDRPAKAAAQTQRIAALAEEAVSNIGEIVWANNPRYDTLEDLITFLREYAANYLDTASIECRLVFPVDLPKRAVPGPFRRQLLAILKEALQNVLKHADARHVEVRVDFTGEHLQLSVQDDGLGMDPEQAGRFGNGLVNIRERAAELQGTCTVMSEPGQGTRVEVHLPLPAGV